jgi:hypothetical protein
MKPRRLEGFGHFGKGLCSSTFDVVALRPSGVRSMPGTAVLDTAIGLAFMFFLVALFCSAAVEAVANFFKKRAKYLLRGLRDLLDTPHGIAPPPEVPLAAAGGDTQPAAVSDAQPVALSAAQPGGTQSRAGAAVATAARNVQEQVYKKFPAASEENQLYRTSLTASSTDAAGLPWVTQVMGHALVAPFKQSRAKGGRTRNPAYLPARTFATTLVDLLVPDADGETSLTQVRKAVVDLPAAVPFRKALLSLLNTAGGDLEKFMTSLEGWYDSQMDRVSGSYKRWAKRWIIVIALVFAAALNVDTIAVGTSLYEDGPLREAVAAAAGNQTLCAQASTSTDKRACVTKELSDLQTSSGLPVGWDQANPPKNFNGWLVKVLGWLITAFAASFGAPFWFASLSKLGSLRNAGNKPTSSTGAA